MQPLAESRSTVAIRRLLPGSIASLIVHAVLLFSVASWLRGCQAGLTGETGGEVFRSIGIVATDGDGRMDQPQAGPPNDAESEQTTHTPEVAPEPVVPAVAPAMADLLNPLESLTPDHSADSAFELPRLIGQGVPAGGVLPSAPGGLVQPSASAGAADGGAAELKPGETAFLGVADSGRNFVYVIDTSQSMGDDNRLEIAKSQLKSSLRLLQPNQKFQVIFYSEAPVRMRIRGQDAPLFAATAANVFLAEQQIDRATPYHGTDHLPAIQDALSLQPDVIYFLTDGHEPQLSPDDLRHLSRVTGGTTIHVIEFADSGLSSRGMSWLERLASQSGGEYRGIVVRKN